MSLINFDAATILQYIRDAGVKDNTPGKIVAWGRASLANGIATFMSSQGAQIAPSLRTYVLFRDNLGSSTLKRYAVTLRDAKVSSGFDVRDALQYERVIMIGEHNDNAALLKEVAERQVEIIVDADASDALGRAKELLGV